jgi:hypothetical protein
MTTYNYINLTNIALFLSEKNKYMCLKTLQTTGYFELKITKNKKDT